jgi:peptidoglycan/LPS O-acetylase OafA/YrhL
MSKLSNQAVYRPFGTFRFFLALLVVFQHDMHLLPPSGRAFFHHAGLGVLAVATFFVISGFIVAEANDTFYRGRPARFMTNRLLRLVPAYLAALVLSCLAYSVLHLSGELRVFNELLSGAPWAPKLILANVLDIVPFFHPRFLVDQDFEFVPFAWTLRVEFAFYIFAFLAFWLMARSLPDSLKSKIGPVFFAGAHGLFIAFLLAHERLPQQLGNIPFFLFGVCIFRLWRKSTAFNMVHALLAGIEMAVAFPFWQQRDAPILSWQYPILTVLIVMFVLLAFAPGLSMRWKSFDRRLGDLSYPLYLNHFVIQLLIANLFSQNLGWKSYAVGVVLSIFLSAFMFWIVETPLKSVRDRVRGTALENAVG